MWDTLARLALAPVLIPQALAVRRRAQQLPEAKGPRAGSAGHGAPLRLRIIGDSSAAGVGATHQTEALLGQLTTHLSKSFAVTWQLDAITGATTASTLDRLKDAHAEPADILILVLGVNDATRLIPRHTWLRQHVALLDKLRHLYGPRHIYLTGMPPLGCFPLLPNPLRWTLGRHAQRLDSAKMAHAADAPDLTHLAFDLALDPAFMAEDGFHPNPTLYAIWGEKMASRITSDWPAMSRR